MELSCRFGAFKCMFEITEQQALEPKSPNLWRLSMVNQKSVFNKAYESKTRALQALDIRLADWLAKEDSLTARVVYANFRESLQALTAEEALTAAKS